MIVSTGFVGLRKKQKNARLIAEEIETESPEQNAFRRIIESDDSFSDHSGFLTLADKISGKKKVKKRVSLVRIGVPFIKYQLYYIDFSHPIFYRKN